MASRADIVDERPWSPGPYRSPQVLKAARRAHVALLAASIGVPVLLVIGYFAWPTNDDGSAWSPSDAATPAVIDAPFAPTALRPLSPLAAEEWNKAVPVSVRAVSPATPFAIGTTSSTTFARSLQCMTEAIYYEAGNEPVDGQRAVAQVILNRMRSPVYPHSVCGVVYQGSERQTGCQFTFTCDGSLARAPAPASWARAAGVAAAALGGYVYAPVGWATNYHADYVVPYWAQSLAKLTTIGRHIFYGWKGRAGTGAGFTSRYAGSEPEVGAQIPVAAAALVAPSAVAPVGTGSVTSADRPVIPFQGADGSAKAGTATSKSGLTQDAHPTVPLGSRWVIGGGGATSAPQGAATTLAARKPVGGEAPVRINGESLVNLE